MTEKWTLIRPMEMAVGPRNKHDRKSERRETRNGRRWKNRSEGGSRMGKLDLAEVNW